MQKTAYPLVLFSLFALSLVADRLAADGPGDPELSRKVDEVFAPWDSTSSPGCALSVIRDGQTIYARGYGMANLEHGLAITPRTIFRIGSTSKQFAAAAIALLAEQGALSLDDDVRQHVPELPEYEAPMTVRHLIHHTSGLRDYLGLMRFSGKRDADYYTNEEVLAKLARQKALNFAPGDRHLYSNSGYFLLSVIVERASGKTLRQFAAEHIFSPLGMRHSHFHDDHREIVPQRATGYSRTADGGFEISQTTLEMVGDGGVFTSVEDLYRWDQNFYHNRLGKGGPQLVELLLTPGRLTGGEALTYAFGLGVSEYKGLLKVAHGGAFVGYRAEMIRFPEEKLSVICLCNLAQTNPSRLAQQVADIYLADKLEVAAPPPEALAVDEAGVEVAAESLARFAGTYFYRPEGRLRTIEVRDGQLFYLRGQGPTSGLKPLADNLFRMLDVSVKIDVRFEAASGGSDPDMVVTVSDGEPNVYTRVDPDECPKDELVRYAGLFYSEELDATYEISAGDKGLVVQLGSEEVELIPAAPDVFAGPFVLEFSRDTAGRVTSFALAAGRVRGIGFERR